MRITCPSCSAAYEVPDSLMTPGRVARCARCGSDWTPLIAPAPLVRPDEPLQRLQRSPDDEPTVAVEAPEAPAVVAPPRQSALDRLAAPAARPRTSTRLRIAWVASLVSLVVAAGAAYLWRGQIVAAWPPSAHAYATFGLHPETEPPK